MSTNVGKKKKLLVITNHSYMLWRFRRELLMKLQEDYEVVISTPFVGHEDDFKNLGFRMIETSFERRKVNPLEELKLLWTYRQMIKRESPDLVITYSIKPNIYAGLVCRLRKVPYVVNVQGLGTVFQKKGLAEVAGILYRIALGKAKKVFFENEENAKLFLEKKITSAWQQKVLPGAGINLEYYACLPYPAHEKVHFLYLGRIMREKGMDELFASVHKLHQNYNGQFQLDLVGFFEDEYKEQVERLEQQDVARFYGFQQDPRLYLEQADCVILPSYHEGLSNVLLEAAATGRPLITSDIPGCRETVCHGKSGLLCPAKDAEGLYEKMESFLALPVEERRKMGLEGRELVKERFEKGMVVGMTVAVIKECIGDARRFEDRQKESSYVQKRTS